jgi:hypothetical protein
MSFFSSGGGAAFTGTLATGTLVIVDGLIAQENATGFTRITGSDVADGGGEIMLFGGAHATQANDIRLIGNASNVAFWDDSANSWTIGKNAASVSLFSAGSAAAPGISFSADSNTGLYSSTADQVQVSLGGVNRFSFSPTSMVLRPGAAGTSSILNDVSDGALRLSADSSVSLGANMQLMGSTNATPNNWAFRTGTTNVLSYDEANAVVTVGGTTTSPYLHVVSSGAFVFPQFQISHTGNFGAGYRAGMRFGALSGATYGAEISLESDDNFYIQNIRPTGDMVFITNSLEQMRITETGSMVLGRLTTNTLGFYGGGSSAAQAAAIADAAGGAVIDTEARTAINALLAAIRAVNLIAT